MSKLTERELDLLINYYIGVREYGRLGNFYHGGTLREFLQVDCDLDIEPKSNRVRAVHAEFIEILVSQPPQYQARIVRAVLEEYFENGHFGKATRQEKLRPKFEQVVQRLESASTLVDDVSPKSKSEVVQVALKNANHLISRGIVPSAVSNTHTALHGYLKQMCDDESIEYAKNASLPKLFKLLQDNHSVFQSGGPHQDKIDNVGKGLSTAIHSLNEIRNQASDAHPNDGLLDIVDATLAVNAMRTIFHYLEDKR